jgi:DNA-binding transcriptional LysR family regulator
MELRHLRCFSAVAEELHFARAAARLHIEQSPLSRTIKELESDLGTQLFERTTRSTRLTFAGQVLLNDVRRLFTVLDQARDNVRAAASGYRGMLRIALSDGIVPQRFSSLLAQCREEEPDIEIRLFEIPLSQQVRGLRDGLYDVGFARIGEVGNGIATTPIWTDQLVVVVPSRHPLLAHKRVSLREVVNYPLILAHPQVSEGWYRLMESMLRAVDTSPVIAEHVGSQELLLALIAAGYGVGFACEEQLAHFHHSDIVIRPLDETCAMVTTYLLKAESNPSPHVMRFMQRVSSKSKEEGNRPT